MDAPTEYEWSLSSNDTPAVTVDPISGTLTADQTWTPYYQGNIVIPYAGVDGIDVQTFLDDWLDPRNYKIWLLQASSLIPSTGAILTIFAVYVTIRSYTVDDIAQTITIVVSTREALLQDYKRAATSARVSSTADISTFVEYALEQVDSTYIPGSLTFPASASITSPANNWLPGQAAWDWITPLLTSQGWVLVDNGNNPGYLGWWITGIVVNPGLNPRNSRSGPYNFSYGDNILALTRAVDFDDSSFAWADSAEVTYNWVDGSGATHQVAYAAAPTIGTPYHRTAVVSYDTADPGFNGATGMVSRLTDRSVVLTATVLQDQFVQTGNIALITLPSGQVAETIVIACTWTFPDNRLVLKLQFVAWE